MPSSWPLPCLAGGRDWESWYATYTPDGTLLDGRGADCGRRCHDGRNERKDSHFVRLCRTCVYCLDGKINDVSCQAGSSSRRSVLKMVGRRRALAFGSLKQVWATPRPVSLNLRQCRASESANGATFIYIYVLSSVLLLTRDDGLPQSNQGGIPPSVQAASRSVPCLWSGHPRFVSHRPGPLCSCAAYFVQ